MSVLAHGFSGPAFEGALESLGVLIAQQVADLLVAEPRLYDVLASQIRPVLVDQLLIVHALRLQVAAQAAGAHVQHDREFCRVRYTAAVFQQDVADASRQRTVLGNTAHHLATVTEADIAQFLVFEVHGSIQGMTDQGHDGLLGIKLNRAVEMLQVMTSIVWAEVGRAKAGGTKILAGGDAESEGLIACELGHVGHHFLGLPCIDEVGVVREAILIDARIAQYRFTGMPGSFHPLQAVGNSDGPEHVAVLPGWC